MFAFLAEILEGNGKGVRAYQLAAAAAREAARKNRDHAVAFFVLGEEAARFVESYHGMPVTQIVAEDAYRRFLSHLQELDVVKDNPVELLRVVNKITLDIMQSGNSS